MAKAKVTMEFEYPININKYPRTDLEEMTPDKCVAYDYDTAKVGELLDYAGILLYHGRARTDPYLKLKIEVVEE